MAKYDDIVNSVMEIYPNATCELEFKNTYELVVAVILSAQCTDKRVNIVTKDLFKKYPTVLDLANADIRQLEQDIKPCGFYHNKASNLKNMAIDVVSKYNREIPHSKEDLLSLAGVGEKTANVILATAYNVPAIAVDTHVFRLSNRLGLAKGDTPIKVQKQLEKRVGRQNWINLHYCLVLHGRYVCKAIKPKCSECKLTAVCKHYKSQKESK